MHAERESGERVVDTGRRAKTRGREGGSGAGVGVGVGAGCNRAASNQE